MGEPGEIQVRGPQLMKGYLGQPATPEIDADGWFSTGDVGYVDEDGYLFVVDRLKDVFKCDNWLVSPTEIERVLLRHPAVAECVVVDHPDPFSGAVAYGFVTRRDDRADAGELIEFANAQMPYYQHLRHLELMDRIPRSPNGKIQRRDLRALAVRRGIGPSTTASTDTRGESMVTLINRLTVTGDQEKFLGLLAEITEHMKAQPGFLSHQLYRSQRNDGSFVEIAEWDNAQAHRAAMQLPGFFEKVKQLQSIASAEPDVFEVVDDGVPATS